MCFITDDCSADVSEESTFAAEKPTRCDECRRMIAVWQTVNHLFQQQYETCRNCDPDQRGEWDDEYEGGDLPQCVDGKCYFGETYDYDCCDDCYKFLQAVQEAEVIAGCSHSESRPALGEMLSDINDGGKDEATKYFAKARELFPELEASGYLVWLHKEMFGDDDEE